MNMHDIYGSFKLEGSYIAGITVFLSFMLIVLVKIPDTFHKSNIK